MQSNQHNLSQDRRRYAIYNLVPPYSLLVDEVKDDGVDPRRGHVSTDRSAALLAADRIRYATVLIVFVSGTTAMQN